MDRLNLSYRRFILAAIVAVVVAAVATVLTVKLSGPVAAADGGLREIQTDFVWVFTSLGPTDFDRLVAQPEGEMWYHRSDLYRPGTIGTEDRIGEMNEEIIKFGPTGVAAFMTQGVQRIFGLGDIYITGSAGDLPLVPFATGAITGGTGAFAGQIGVWRTDQIPGASRVTFRFADPLPDSVATFFFPNDLLVSKSSNRSDPIPLEGETVSGKIYVFVSTAEDADRVNFFLDDPAMTGSPDQTENNHPWDFAGGSPSTANAFKTWNVSNGLHTITAEIEPVGGGTVVVSETFTVDN